MQAKIFEALVWRPRHREQLCELLWGDDPNGGPLTRSETLRVHISKLRKYLRSHGMSVAVSRGTYRIVGSPAPIGGRGQEFMCLSLPT